MQITPGDRIPPSGPLISPGQAAGLPMQNARARVMPLDEPFALTVEFQELYSGAIPTSGLARPRIKGVPAPNIIQTEAQYDVLLNDWTGEHAVIVRHEVSRDEGATWIQVTGETYVWPPSVAPDSGENPQWNSQRVRFTSYYRGNPPWNNVTELSATVIARVLIRLSSEAASANVVIDQAGGYVELCEFGPAISPP